MYNRNIFIFACLMFVITVLLPAQEKTYSPDEVIKQLLQSNSEFKESLSLNTAVNETLKRTAKGQHPYAIVLTCADSRVVPEIIFNKTIGELFVIRVAGNIIDESTLGSIEYAAKHLHSPYFLVLGHTHCGAVHAAVAGGSYSPSINAIVESILPAVNISRHENSSEEEINEAAIRENVFLQINNALSKSELLRELVSSNRLKIGGGIYDILTGKVEFIK
ncbi:MAG: carbonic anhydrase [Melioribacteraceae bacterium]|nr:carbonic anhydrase [Melioribacteraceae bacterium]MDD3558259.1 carbonic anhydrase [Melioribacteraceae bacterium]